MMPDVYIMFSCGSLVSALRGPNEPSTFGHVEAMNYSQGIPTAVPAYVFSGARFSLPVRRRFLEKMSRYMR